MRSERRHQRKRLKAKRRFHGGRDLRGNERALGMAVETACACSCFLCSARKRGERSIDELRAQEAWQKIERA